MSWPAPGYEHKVLTLSGRLLDLKDPDPADIAAGDIAHNLSRQVRYVGATRDYTVAQHSVAVAKCVYDNWGGYPGQLRAALRFALMHDAAEAYIRDVPTPAKKLLPDYRRLEDRIMGAVVLAFRLGEGWENSIIKEADLSLCGAESRLFFAGRTDLGLMFPPATLEVDRELIREDWSPDKAKDIFIRLWNDFNDRVLDGGLVDWGHYV